MGWAEKGSESTAHHSNDGHAHSIGNDRYRAQQKGKAVDVRQGDLKAGTDEDDQESEEADLVACALGTLA